MVRLHVTLVAVFTAGLLAGCVGQLSAGARVRAPRAVVVAGGAPAGAAPIEAGPPPADAPLPEGAPYAAGEDRHWVQPDDYFVVERAWSRGWQLIHLAKLQQAPGPDSKGQALFFQVRSGRDLWTEHYWQTREARPEDLVVGAFAICFHDRVRDRVHLPPASKHQARTGHWFMGRISDVSDAFKHQVRVATSSCSIDAVRVMIPRGAPAR